MTDEERIAKLERKVKALEDYVERVAPLIKQLPREQSKAQQDAVNLLDQGIAISERIRNLGQRNR